jgi:hypothetical protein
VFDYPFNELLVSACFESAIREHYSALSLNRTQHAERLHVADLRLHGSNRLQHAERLHVAVIVQGSCAVKHSVNVMLFS